jgi:hypothetical protein
MHCWTLWLLMAERVLQGGVFASVDELLAEAARRVAVSDVSGALEVVQRFVKSVNTDPRAIARVFGDHALDCFCQQLGQAVLAKMGDEASCDAPLPSSGPVYLATELYRTGGHTAVLEDLIKIKAFPGKPTIVLTNTLGTADIDAIHQRFRAYDVAIHCAPGGALEQRLLWTLKTLRQLRPSTLVLFNHHEDSVAIAAAQPQLAAQTVFYHHADHHLCLGVTLPYDLHADPSPMGYHNCRDALRLSNNVYWPLTAEDRGHPGTHRRSLTAGERLRTCSAGTRNKFEQPYRFDYADVVPRILAATNGSHVHIGLLSESTLERIAAGMRRASIPADRLTYIEWVPSLWQALQDERVDVYIGSFPITGSRSIVEALGSGTPVVGHQSYLSRFHGGADMLYPQAAAWRTPDDLCGHLAGLTPDRVREEAELARAHFDAMHTLKQLEATVAAGLVAPAAPALRPFAVDPLQVLLDDMALFVTRQSFDAQVQALRAEVEASRASIDAIYASRSWKVARSLIALASKLRAVRLPS